MRSEGRRRSHAGSPPASRLVPRPAIQLLIRDDVVAAVPTSTAPGGQPTPSPPIPAHCRFATSSPSHHFSRRFFRGPLNVLGWLLTSPGRMSANRSQKPRDRLGCPCRSSAGRVPPPDRPSPSRSHPPHLGRAPHFGIVGLGTTAHDLLRSGRIAVAGCIRLVVNPPATPGLPSRVAPPPPCIAPSRPRPFRPQPVHPPARAAPDPAPPRPSRPLA